MVDSPKYFAGDVLLVKADRKIADSLNSGAKYALIYPFNIVMHTFNGPIISGFSINAKDAILNGARQLGISPIKLAYSLKDGKVANMVNMLVIQLETLKFSRRRLMGAGFGVRELDATIEITTSMLDALMSDEQKKFTIIAEQKERLQTA